MRRKQAFTLIELLVVMAITAVMMTLIVLPIFQSFNLTRNAQAFADAQDKARILTERIAREVGNAVTVRGGTSTSSYINYVDVTTANYGTISVPNTSVIARLPGKDGKVVETVLPNSKLDLVPPATGDPGDRVNGAYRDPNTGKGDPTLMRPKGDIRLPVAPGATIVRWFIGLKDPSRIYNEPYTGLLQTRAGGADNLYVLRRAEVQPYVYRDNKNGASNSKAWRPNLNYFQSDDETDTQIIDLDDPRFFILDQGQTPVTDAQKSVRVANWLKASTIQTEVSRYDMIRPVTSGPTGAPIATYYTAAGKTNVPVVVPLVQFVPTRVASTPAAGSAAARPGEAIDGLDRIGPDTYQTERGLWANAIARYYPAGYDPNTANNAMQVAMTDDAGKSAIFAGGASATGLDGILAAPNNFELFDNNVYEQVIARGGAYPFTQAALAADDYDLNTAPSPPARRWTPESSMRATFTPFRVITSTGKIITSFPIEEVGNPDASVKPQPNLPLVNVGAAYSTPAAYSPTQAVTLDPNYASAPFSPVGSGNGAYDMNRAYNRAWNAYPELQGMLQRFIDLRMVANEDGTFSPLNPVPAIREIRGFNLIPQLSKNSAGATVNSGGLMNRVRIVPGSDEVYGPDQTVAGTYATIVRYTRVSGNPGPNQYRLVYADLPEPVNASGKVDYSVLGISSTLLAGFDPATYDGNNVVSAMIQSRYKAGYLQFCSDPNVPVPPGRVTVRYRFQFNGPSDTFAVDYDTREVMQVLLTIKNYPQSNVPNAQLITLKSTATLRNALR